MKTRRKILLSRFLKDLRDGERHPALRDKYELTDSQYLGVLQEALHSALTKAPGTGLHGLPSKWKGKCTDVLDGDTISVLWRDCPITIRLYGIDAPEKRQPGYVDAFEALRTLVDRREVGVMLRKGGV